MSIDKPQIIPFTIKDVQFGDRLIHYFWHNSKLQSANLGKVYYMFWQAPYDKNIKESFTVVTDKLGFPLQPHIGGWNVHIDRRPARKRFISELFG